MGYESRNAGGNWQSPDSYYSIREPLKMCEKRT